MRRGIGQFCLVILLLAAFMPTMAGGQQGAGQTPAGPSLPATQEPDSAPGKKATEPVVIAVEDIAVKATEAADHLRALGENLMPESQVAAIRRDFTEAVAENSGTSTRTMELLHQQPGLPVLQAQQQQWLQTRLRLTQWLEVLTRHSRELKRRLHSLETLNTIWNRTIDGARQSGSPSITLDQATRILTAIERTRVSFQERHVRTLTLQGQIGEALARCGEVLALIVSQQNALIADMAARNSRPIWSADVWNHPLAGLGEKVDSVAATLRRDLGAYFTAPYLHVQIFLAVSLVFLPPFLLAGRRLRRWQASGDAISPFFQIFTHPLVAALSVALLVATAPQLSLPVTIRALLQLIALAPMIILVRPLVGRQMLLWLCLLGLLFTVDVVREILIAEHRTGQFLLIVEALMGLAMAGRILLAMQRTDSRGKRPFLHFLVRIGLVAILLLLLAALGAAAVGYLGFARQMVTGIVVGAVLVFNLYVAIRILMGVVAMALQVRPLRLLGMVARHRALIERRAHMFLLWLASGVLLLRYLGYAGLLEPAIDMAKDILTTPYERGFLHISLANVLEFLATVWAASLFSAFLRFVLNEDVFPRLQLTRGKSYAITNILHYLILALGFTAALAVLGVDLSKLSVLTGALGVGIGFGLQSVVNNFVSGLILLFERPIQVGDTIEVGDIQGKIRRIGIRASTVLTRRGADIVVPNSQLVTERVTNWTLSDQLKRIDLPVGISYSTEPREVIALLEAVAGKHPHILEKPAPLGLLVGFGDSAINFELRAWTDQFDDWARIQSELAAAVYDAVHAAGMVFPFPQREVRLLMATVNGDSPEQGFAADAPVVGSNGRTV